MTDEIARAIAIPAVFLITAFMMKTYLSHQEKMKGTLDHEAGS